jgi:hypothetical protein
LAHAINLVFFYNPRRGGMATFAEAARRISAREPRISASAWSSRERVYSRLPRLIGLARRPTVSIEMNRVRFPPPFRGARFRPHWGEKVQEMRALEAAGIPVPRWEVIRPETKLDPQSWGPYVVVKPSNAKRGAYVRVTRTRRVAYVRPEDHEAGHPGREAPMIAQEFIYTGPIPESFRVVTFFGRVVCAFRHIGRPQAHLKERFGFKTAGGGLNIVASAVGCSAVPADSDHDVLALARRVHSAFPDIPTLGIDIIRDADTGKLYVLETNPSGGSWPFDGTNQSLAYVMQRDPREQFGAIDVIADAAIDLALRRAV